MNLLWHHLLPSDQPKEKFPAINNHVTNETMIGRSVLFIPEQKFKGGTALLSYHSLKSKSVQILCSIVPQDICSTARACSAPILNFSHFSPSTRSTLIKRQLSASCIVLLLNDMQTLNFQTQLYWSLHFFCQQSLYINNQQTMKNRSRQSELKSTNHSTGT